MTARAQMTYEQSYGDGPPLVAVGNPMGVHPLHAMGIPGAQMYMGMQQPQMLIVGHPSQVPFGQQAVIGGQQPYFMPGQQAFANVPVCMPVQQQQQQQLYGQQQPLPAQAGSYAGYGPTQAQV